MSPTSLLSLAKKALEFLSKKDSLSSQSNNNGSILNTPVSELRAPLSIESNFLEGEIIFLCANEEQALKVEAEGKVAYGPEEVAILLNRFNFIEKEEWASYLKSIHMVKRTFEGSKVTA